MNIGAYDLESLRNYVRSLQEENQELRRQLREKGIPTADSTVFSVRKEDIYDPDQGERITPLEIDEQHIHDFFVK
ncbi:MAG: hypothetical protein LKF53_07805 [Solobacterium sp.]|jgi:hypothetical protein|nr:hypothetical protein [Solobacterium sp.]MCH4206279.1 hypothetical protein [Solobacterium sp.]MCH4227745.1 hypothetical protein [Solobacterium sp.]